MLYLLLISCMTSSLVVILSHGIEEPVKTAQHDQMWYQIYRRDHPDEIHLDTDCQLLCTFYSVEEEPKTAHVLMSYHRHTHIHADIHRYMYICIYVGVSI